MVATPVNCSPQELRVNVHKNARLALRLSEYGYVFETGRLAMQGTSVDLLNNPYISDAYLGGATAPASGAGQAAVVERS